MCPITRIGTVDLFLGLHHGQKHLDSEVMMSPHPSPCFGI